MGPEQGLRDSTGHYLILMKVAKDLIRTLKDHSALISWMEIIEILNLYYQCLYYLEVFETDYIVSISSDFNSLWVIIFSLDN